MNSGAMQLVAELWGTSLHCVHDVWALRAHLVCQLAVMYACWLSDEDASSKKK